MPPSEGSFPVFHRNSRQKAPQRSSAIHERSFPPDRKLPPVQLHPARSPESALSVRIRPASGRDLLLEWDYEKNREVRPDSIAANSTAVVWWKCRNGHGWKAAVYSRHAGKGCPYCANRKILPGYNDLAATEPELLKEWDYRKNTVRPEHISRASRVRVWWKCCEGHSWKTSPACFIQYLQTFRPI